MEAGKSNRRQPGPIVSSERDRRASTAHRRSGDGFSTPMQERENRRPIVPVQQKSKGIIPTPIPPKTPLSGKGKSDQRQDVAPSTTPDPRKHRRNPGSFMGPTSASASKRVDPGNVRPREVRSRPTTVSSPRSKLASGAGKAKNTAKNGQGNFEGAVRTSNGVTKNRKTHQKQIRRKSAMNEVTLESKMRGLQVNEKSREIEQQSETEEEEEEDQHNRRVRRDEREDAGFQGSSKGSLDEEFSFVEEDVQDAERSFAHKVEEAMTLTEPRVQEGAMANFSQSIGPQIPQRTSSNPVKPGWQFPGLPWSINNHPRINVDALIAQNQHLNSQVSYLRRENAGLTSNLQELKHIKDHHESEFRMLQAQSLKEMAKSIWSPLEDHVIREILESIHKEIEDWAEENSVRAFQDINKSRISDAEAQSLLSYFKDMAVLDSDNLWAQFHRWEDREIDPELILTAVTTLYMYDRVFRNPFLVLDAFDDQIPFSGQLITKDESHGKECADHVKIKEEGEQAESQVQEHVEDEREDEPDQESEAEDDGSVQASNEIEKEIEGNDVPQRMEDTEESEVESLREDEEDSEGESDAEDSQRDSNEEDSEDSEENSDSEGEPTLVSHQEEVTQRHFEMQVLHSSQSQVESKDANHVDAPGELAVSQKTSLMMMDTYSTLLKFNVEQSQLWRSQMMKILFPTPSPGTRFDGLRPADDKINKYLRSYCEHQVHEFEQSPARILFGDGRSEESRLSLIECWERLVHLFTQLQTQLRMVRWTAPDQAPLAGQNFDVKLMDGHCTQTYRSKDGVPVSLVVSPAVVLLGNEDGRNYKTERIVVKAVVLVDDEEVEAEL